MLFKNILFGLGGTAVVGGIGYGIYASSQTNKKDENNVPTNENLDDKNEDGSLGDKNDDNSKTEQDEGKSAGTQGKDSEGSNVTGSSEKTGGSSGGGPGA